MSTLTVGWKVSTLSASIASVRYRALLPILALEADNVGHVLFDESRLGVLDGLDALVIVKSFVADDLALAHEAVRRGVPVIFDLCDNVFIGAYKGKNFVSPASMLQVLAKHLTAIVVTTEPLAEVTRAAVGGKVPVHVIPDGIEDRAALVGADALIAHARKVKGASAPPRYMLFARAIKRRAQVVCAANLMALVRNGELRRRLHKQLLRLVKYAYRRYDALRTAVWRRPARESFDSRPAVAVEVPFTTSRRILWFGNHGAEHARFGMLDLLEIRDALETVASEFDVELLVVSNHHDKYLKHIKPLAIRSLYVEWSPLAMEQAFASAKVVVIPNSRDAFSICKSANRTVLALTHGVPVVATLTPALEVLRECIESDDTLGGLRRYLGDDASREEHLTRARKLIEAHFGPVAISRAWREVILSGRQVAGAAALSSPDLLVVIHLAQDIDLAAPLIAAGRAHGIEIEVWYNVVLHDKSPRSIAVLQEMAISCRVISESMLGCGAVVFPKSAKALLTVAETNLRPHELTRYLTEAANRAGLVTGTLQHGFENVGLTYSDDVHAIGKIDFAAQRIYLWGEPDTLHPEVGRDTRRKCVTVGCPKPVAVEAMLPEGLPAGRSVIGVFENLHWHRYDEAYRDFFLQNVGQLAKSFPSLLFLVKPHHAGMWLTSRFEGKALIGENIVIADPQSEEWEAYTAPSLLGHLSAVITTPSTVALDAARRGLPTAVVGRGLQLDNYRPLSLIETTEDWRVFVGDAIDEMARYPLIEASQQFVQRNVVSGDAPLRILSDLLNRDDLSLSGKEA